MPHSLMHTPGERGGEGGGSRGADWRGGRVREGERGGKREREGGGGGGGGGGGRNKRAGEVVYTIIIM